MRTDILMVTYKRDIEFAKYAIRSVDKFATGFGCLVIVVPFDDIPAFKELIEFRGDMGFPMEVCGFYERPGKGMLHHEVMVCMADHWCPKADHILHMDADSVFTGPVRPEDYVVDGKPVMYRERYADFQHHPNRKLWQGRVFDATGIMPEWETMVRHPFVYTRKTYGLVRESVEKHVGVKFEDYVLSCDNNYPQTFAEYPTIGAMCIEKLVEDYHWVDWSNNGADYVYQPGRDKIKNFWSHAGIEKYRAELDEMLK